MSSGWFGRGKAVPGVAIALVSLAACGGDDNSPALPALAEQGRGIARTNGCAACHGHDGEGGVGPAFTGLYGSQVALADGSTVVADAGYLTEAIRAPAASEVVGYDIGMPASDLDDAQIAAVVAYIRALAGTDGTP